MGEVITYITANWESIIAAITAVVTAAAAITALTPSTKDDSVVAKIRKVLNLLALNIGNAKSK